MKAKEIGLDQVLTFFLYNSKHKVGFPHIQEFYKDRTYTYFSRSGKSYKALSSELKKFDPAMITGDSIRSHLIYSIIPKEERESNKDCTGSFVSPRFTCKYIDSVNIEVTCHYKITCNVIPIVNKNYVVRYNLKERTNKLITVSKAGHQK